jgi:hypothetical protein
MEHLTALGEACGRNSKEQGRLQGIFRKCLGMALDLPLLSATYFVRFTRISLHNSELAVKLAPELMQVLL